MYILQIFEEVIDNLTELIKSYKPLCNSKELSTHLIYKYKVNHLSMVLKRRFNVVARFTRNLITEIVDCRNEEIIKIVFR